MLNSNGKVWLFFPFLSILLLTGCGKKSPTKEETIPRIAKAYVTREDHSVSVIDLEKTEEIKDIPVDGYSIGVAITPDYNYAYVTCSGPGEVYKVKINTDTTVGSLKVEGNPGGIVISRDGSLAYVVNTGPNSKSIIVINLDSDMVETKIDLNEPSTSIALTPDDSEILVAQRSADAIWVMDAKSYTIIKQIAIDEPYYITISRDGDYAYVASSSNWISQISLSTFTQTHRFQAGDYPLGAVENPINGDLLVSNRLSLSYQGSILVLDSDFTVQDTIDTDGFPTAMVFSQDGTSLWITVGKSGGPHSLLSIDAGNYVIKNSLTLEGSWPMDLAIVPRESGGEPLQQSP